MLVLHGSAGSPYVARVRMQGYAKDLALELRPAAPNAPEFRRMNPLARRLVRRVWAEMDEAFRAFMARRQAEQAATAG